MGSSCELRRITSSLYRKIILDSIVVWGGCGYIFIKDFIYSSKWLYQEIQCHFHNLYSNSICTQLPLAKYNYIILYDILTITQITPKCIFL